MGKKILISILLCACSGLICSANFDKAIWIGAPWEAEEFNRETVNPAPEFKKEIFVEKKIKNATAYICGLGFFELRINGNKISDDVLCPNETSYGHRPNLVNCQPIPTDDSRFAGFRVNYLQYDISKEIKKNRNEISVLLGNGLYSTGRIRWIDPYGSPRLICRIEINYADGTTENVVSDTEWEVRKSGIVHNDLFEGEDYDSRIDSQYEKAVERKAPDGKLVEQTSPSDKIMEVLKAKSITKLEEGKWEVDFGEYITGWVRLKNFTLEDSKAITIEFPCEVDSYNGKNIYIGNGRKVKEYAPKFTWFTFSKAIISGWPGELKKANVQAEAVYSDVEQNSEFHCSNELFNTLNKLWCRTMRNNMHLGVATDCPHREKGPYTGDGQVSCVTAMHNFDMRSFYRKWFADMRDCQDTVSGYVPNGAPWHPGCGGGLAWGAAMVIMPWEYYRHYGDKSILEENYEAMKGQMRFMMGWKEENGLINMNTDYEWKNLGEWSVWYNMPRKELVFTYFCWKCAGFMQNAAEVLGKKEDSLIYGVMKDELWTAFHRELYDENKKSYGEMDGANIFALAMGVPESRLEDVKASVRREIEENGYHLNTGIFGTQLFFEVLADNGMNDLAFAAMNQRTQPSFGYMVDNGAKAIWEQWDGGNSRNHHMYGGAFCWFYRKLAGLESLEPGYKTIFFRPMPVGDVTSASYRTMTVQGEASIEWRIRNGKMKVRMRVPEGCKAEYELPDGSKGTINRTLKRINIKWN